MDMVPAASKKQAVAKLVESVSAANGNMLVGMFGIKWCARGKQSLGGERVTKLIFTVFWPRSVGS